MEDSRSKKNFELDYQMEIFYLKGHEYIELNKLLKRLQWAETGGEANIHIDQGEVMVNENVETRRRNKLRAGDIVSFGENQVVIK